jgi:hypothetical protein
VLCLASVFGLFIFVCLRTVSCVPNVSSVSGLSIIDYPFGFLKRSFVDYKML